MLSDVHVATYRPEIERYGGDAGFRMAEVVFCADSNFVIDCLSPGEPSRDQLIVDATVHLDSMTGAWGLADSQKRRIASHMSGGIPGGSEYRRLGSKIWTAVIEHNTNEAAMHLTDTLKSLHQVVETSREDDVLSSVLHMHLNRLGIERSIEPVVYGVWRRHLDRSLLRNETFKVGSDS